MSCTRLEIAAVKGEPARSVRTSSEKKAMEETAKAVSSKATLVYDHVCVPLLQHAATMDAISIEMSMVRR